MPTEPNVKVCAVCGREFVRTPGRTNEEWRSRVTCSTTCGALYRKQLYQKGRTMHEYEASNPEWKPDLPIYLFRKDILARGEEGMRVDKDLCILMFQHKVSVKELIEELKRGKPLKAKTKALLEAYQ